MFPGVEDTAKIESFSKLLIEEIESWDVVVSLDRITASLTEVEDLKALSINLNNNPPDIYFKTEPSVLVSIDGDPIINEIENIQFGITEHLFLKVVIVADYGNLFNKRYRTPKRN